MLIEYTDGKSGIIEYLEGGRKAGRDFTRDELDKRVTILGDIDTTEMILNSTDKGYKHITLSFKEDNVSEEECKKLIDEYMAFAMHGYKPEEYNAYAEIHQPKQKSYVGKNGELVIRKPHIHLVIPKTNLLTNKQLRPLGFVKQNLDFTDSFQEKYNIENGYASPKNNRSNKISNDINERFNADIFDKNIELKQDISNMIIKDDIRNFLEFQDRLKEYGEMKITHERKLNEYLSVKEPHHQRYTRLKEFVFSREFIENYTKEQKIEFMLEKQEERFIEKQPAQEKSALKKYNKNLKYWYDLRAKEIKYINQSTKFYKEQYRNYTKEQKIEYLENFEKEFYKNNSIEIDGVNIGDIEIDGVNIRQINSENEIEIESLNNNSVVGQKLYDFKEQKSLENLEIKDDLIFKIYTILKQDKGVLENKIKYDAVNNTLFKNNDSQERIGLKDFMVQEMSLSANEIHLLQEKIHRLENQMEVYRKGQKMAKFGLKTNIKTNNINPNKVDYYQLATQDVAGRMTGVIHDKASQHDTAKAYVINDKVVSLVEFKQKQPDLFEAIEDKTNELFSRTTSVKYNDKFRMDVQSTDVALTPQGKVFANSKHNFTDLEPVEMGMTKFDKKLDKNFFTIAKDFVTMKEFRDNLKVKWDDFKQDVKAVFTEKPELAATNIALLVELKQLKAELADIKTYQAAEQLAIEYKQQTQTQNQMKELDKAYAKDEISKEDYDLKMQNLDKELESAQKEPEQEKDPKDMSYKEVFGKLQDMGDVVLDHAKEADGVDIDPGFKDKRDTALQLLGNLKDNPDLSKLSKEALGELTLGQAKAANMMIGIGMGVESTKNLDKFMDVVKSVKDMSLDQGLDFEATLTATLSKMSEMVKQKEFGQAPKQDEGIER